MIMGNMPAEFDQRLKTKVDQLLKLDVSALYFLTVLG